MRLPQSFLRRLSVYFVRLPLTGLMLLMFGLAPSSAVADSPQLECAPSNIRFGKVDVGQSETLMITLTNTGQTSVALSAISVSNPTFAISGVKLPVSLSAGQSLDVNVTFIPAVDGWTGATIGFASNASNSNLVIEVGGTGVNHEAVSASPSSLSFSQAAVGSKSTLSVVLTNLQTWKTQISAAQTTNPAFTVSGQTFPITLLAGKSATLTITFTPTSSGTVGGSVFVSGPGISIPLTGTGTSTGPGQLAISPTALSYGNVSVGTTDTLPLTMSAVGASVTVSSASSSSSQFVMAGASFPLTIASGQSVALNVAFTPKASGTVSGSLSFSSNATNSQASESMTGVGTTTPYSVSIWWNSSSDVVGYNVYRSTSASGSYSKINTALDANTAYTDSTVASGNTYYYAATSVNSGGQESSLSTPAVQAVVP
jgi:hypothetical protein